MPRWRTRPASTRASPAPCPTWIGEVDLALPAPDVRVPAHDAPYQRARLLIRRGQLPVALLDFTPRDGVIEGSEIAQAVADASTDTRPQEIDAPDIGARQPFTVIVCTRDRPESLRRTLESLATLPGSEDEILVIDSAPRSDEVARIVAEAGDPRVRHLPEPIGGLSRARNLGVLEARHEYLAFTDDDVAVDRFWLDGLARGFAAAAHVGCVTGAVLPARLETAAELYFDAAVDWPTSMRSALFDLDRHRGDTPLYPYAAGRFGTGANFALRASVVRRIGGFDEALGAGMPAAGGEDLDLFVRVVLSGSGIAYEPSAIVWHHHRSDLRSLRRQMRAYGSSMSAYGFKHLVYGRAAAPVARALRQRSGDARSPAGRQRPQAPAGVRSAWLAGVATGPLAYLQGRRTVRRQRPLLRAPARPRREHRPD